MTRKEQIREAIDKTFPCTNEGRCYEQALGASGFELGVKWADEHPNLESIWHDANEEPLYNEEIIYQDEDNYVFITDIEDKEFYENGWKGLIKMDCVVRWAYVKDILPKGGGIE